MRNQALRTICAIALIAGTVSAGSASAGEGDDHEHHNGNGEGDDHENHNGDDEDDDAVRTSALARVQIAL